MDGPKVRWGLVIITALVSAAVFAGIFFAWYSSKVLVSYRRSDADRARAEAMEMELREKYCTGGPYENEVIRGFCGGR